MEFLYESGGRLRTLSVDATIREKHSAAAEVTEHAVESGVSLADHVRQVRDRLSLEIHVSNTPLRSFDDAKGAIGPIDLSVTTRPLGAGLTKGATPKAGAEWSPAKIGGKANLLQFTSEFDRVRAVWEVLTALKEFALPVQIVTSIRQYDEAVIVGLEIERTAGTANASTISVELVTILTADSETVDEPLPLETLAERRGSAGPQPPVQQTETETETQDESFAHAGLDRLYRFLGD